MTRFNITLQEGVDMVLWSLENSLGGEIFVPKLPSYRITDLATAIGPDCEHRVTGIRPGEKIHEEMITSSDSFCTLDLGKYYAVLPASGSSAIEGYVTQYKGTKVPENFAYNSGTNPHFLSVEDLRSLIRGNLESSSTLESNE
jgi:FlaA1/EpsC-like NDP-sugar epimerase